MDLTPYTSLRVAAPDLNGQLRGKRIPVAYGAKLANGGVRMPFSASNVDIFGCDIEDSPLVFDSGDADGMLLPTDRGVVPMPWLDSASGLVLMTLNDDDGAAFSGDPRHALQSVLDRYAARGWQVIAATELEFYLTDLTDKIAPAINPTTKQTLGKESVLSVRELDYFDGFFSDVYAASAQMGLSPQAATSEGGVGQFEINLDHGPAMRCADDTLLFKELVKGCARKHGMAATFLPKPFARDAGNGLHVHFSILDERGGNLFAADNTVLRHAVAGCLTAMRASTLLFAPHANSYARLVPNSHAPTGVAWGHDNRTTALRIPGGAPQATRIEHRVSGGDVNPYLMLAGILGAAMNGIEDQVEPPAPLSGNAYGADLEQLAADWATAIELWETDPHIARIFAPDIIRNFAMTKRQELRKSATYPGDSLLPEIAEIV